MNVEPVMQKFSAVMCLCGQPRSVHAASAGVPSGCTAFRADPASRPKPKPKGALIRVTDRDAAILAHVLSYARRAGFETLDAKQVKQARRMIQQLAGALEALDFDADCALEARDKDYHETRKLFDPDWEV